jgi:hypothetical protein
MKEIPSRNYSAFAVSMAVHVVIMLAMWMYRFNVLGQDEIVVETIFINERLHQEYSQELEQTEIAEQITLVSGGMVSTAVGASSEPTLNRVKIEKLESLQEPIFKLNIAEITAPADGVLAEDLGEGQVTGEVGAMVEGYGEALSRISKELIRLMREQKVLVVWLFDESESMKDDQAEIRQEFGTVYAELEIAQRKVKVLRRKKNEDVLLTSVVGFGKEIHTLTRKPTSDVNEIRAAIDRIPIDDSGEEYTCQAIAAVIDQYHKQAVRQKRKLVVIVVSDESGNGGQFVEATVTKAKRAKVPVYILGRESVFGYPYAQIVWKDPLYGLPFWVQIYRGPETAFPECLQWDGLRARHDAFSAGFGPYEQVRIAKETGGIFFVLPSEEENLSGAGAHEERKFRAYDMKQYQPLLLSRREYLQRRNRSKFRTQIWNVIAKLNPHTDKQLNIKEWHYSIDPVAFHREGLREHAKAVRALFVEVHLDRHLGLATGQVKVNAVFRRHAAIAVGVDQKRRRRLGRNLSFVGKALDEFGIRVGPQ